MRIGLIVVAGLLAALAVLLLSSVLIDDYFARRYYARHPLISEMREAGGGTMGEQVGARQALVSRIPVGTFAGEAVELLTAQGFRCDEPKRIDGRFLALCGFEEDPGLIYSTPTNWHIELPLDDNERVSDIRVLMLK